MMAADSPALEQITTTLFVKNIHCPSCVTYARDVLEPLSEFIEDIQISIIDHTIRVQHKSHISGEITQELIDAAFEVEHVVVKSSTGTVLREHNVEPPNGSVLSKVFGTMFMSSPQKQHMKNCNACQEHRRKKIPWATLLRTEKAHQHSRDTDVEKGGVVSESIGSECLPIPSVRDAQSEVYTARYLIQGMTCASCISAVTREVRKLEYVRSIDVNLVTNTAKVVFEGSRSRADEIKDNIEGIGYGAEIDCIQSSDQINEASGTFEVSLVINGMTCASCVSNITEGLQKLSCIEDIRIDLLSNTAVVRFEGESNVQVIVDEINDLGYETWATKARRISSGSDLTVFESKERSVEIQIDGMYCPKCPDNITTAITQVFARSVTISQKPTMNVPRLSVVYIPSPPDLTLRKIINTVNSVDSACSASVYHPTSLEQRSKIIRRTERNRILRHLLVVFLIAVPSFVIGVVFMSLVPSSNATRQWFKEPIWAGNAKRMDWALFILTTPAMFYGASLFHARAVKEIWTLWRPKSKIPLLRRFYRFGSMNLLMSAGTSVAYFASLAVLIMDATTPTMASMTTIHTSRSTTTYFDTVTFLTFFILIGRYLEAYSKAKAGDAVSMLADLRPSIALLHERVTSNNQTDEVTQTIRIPVDLLEVGDTVSVPHGACPPTDGIISKEGAFIFDESSLTGESRPARKIRGDKIFTGSTNKGDPVTMTVTELGGKSMLDRIINVVREGQSRRAPIERFADAVTGFFTPLITLLAISTWVIWLTLGESGALPQGWLDVDEGGWTFWSIEFAIAVFVVACPCGIGLAAPTALFVGGGLAAKSGILVQGGGEAFQEASKLDAIVFDKTGTLTQGRMKVTNVEFLGKFPGIERSTVLSFVKLMEENSSHPIANAIMQRCLEEMSDVNQLKMQVVKIREVSGQGMYGKFKIVSDVGSAIYETVIGNEFLLSNLAVAGNAIENHFQGAGKVSVSQLNIFLSATLAQLQNSGKTTAIFGVRQINGTTGQSTESYLPIAVFAVTDPIRDEAPRVLQLLRDQGLAVYMCTGDNAQTAQSIASQLSIPVENVRAGAMPQDKAAFINELQGSSAQRKVVGFVGDGTNDTPALTAADVSIALSHAEGGGSDIALTSSSFVLLKSDLNSILNLVKLSKRVFLRVKMNFVWAAIYNICLIPVAAGVLFPIGATWGEDAHGGFRLDPVWASVAMAGSSISVVLSSLALKLPEIELIRFVRWLDLESRTRCSDGRGR